MDKEQIIAECRQKCTCPKRRWSQGPDNDEFCGDQRTFLSFATETITVIAFIFFGSVVFWLAVAGVLFDFIKRIYYSDRYVKIFLVGLITLLLLSMAVRSFVNKRSCRAQHLREQMEREKKSVTVAEPPTKPPQPPQAPQPPLEYMLVTFKDKHLRYMEDLERRDVRKTFTLTIADEKKRQVFKTSKDILIPELAMQMNKSPALNIKLKDIVLEDY